MIITKASAPRHFSYHVTIPAGDSLTPRAPAFFPVVRVRDDHVMP